MVFPPAGQARPFPRSSAHPALCAAFLRLSRRAGRGAALAAMVAGALALGWAHPASAALTVRMQQSVTGDFLLVGNTLAHDCAGGGPTPLLGTVGACGTLIGEAGADVYWSASDADALANLSIPAASARSTASLAVPAGATIRYARLYWSGRLPAGIVAADATVDLTHVASATTSTLTADATWVRSATSPAPVTWYQGTADVTPQVVARGDGAWRVSGLTLAPLADAELPGAYAAWWLFVVWERAGEPTHFVSLQDGFELVEAGSDASALFTGFELPLAGLPARLGIAAYDGSNNETGDALLVNGTALGDPQNPVDNFFNSTRSELGTARTVVGDLPQLAGTPGSHSGFDLDIADISPLLRAGDTSLSVRATTTGDRFLAGAVVTSVTTKAPAFTTATQVVRDVNGGFLRPTDELEVTLTARNDGGDAAGGVIFRETIPSGLEFVADSLRIGGTALTNASGDDAADYDATSRAVTFRLGAGADASSGGVVAAGATVEARYRVRASSSVSGTLSMQATVFARDLAGARALSWRFDGDATVAGVQPASLYFDACATSADCRTGAPLCDTSIRPTRCVGCLRNQDCPDTAPYCAPDTLSCAPCTAAPGLACTDPARPVCRETGLRAGRCLECDTGRTERCTGATSFCLADTGQCVGCRAASDCPDAAPFCDPASRVCRPCSASPATACTEPARPACQQGGPLLGSCTQCSVGSSSLCTGATPLCLAEAGLCVGCRADAECPAQNPYCDLSSHTCRPCGEAPASFCADPARPVCQRSGPLAGSCTECSDTSTAACPQSAPLCLQERGACVGCRSGADCAGQRPYCDPATHSCRACGQAPTSVCSDPAAPACNRSGPLSGACSECSASDVSRCAGARPLCDTTQGVCVGCRGNADCPRTAPVCDSRSRACGPCQLAPSVCTDAALPACGDEGAVAGQCAECSSTDRRRCDAGHPFCLAGTCVGCRADGDCPAQTPRCLAGRQVCAACASSADCGGTTPYCEPTLGLCRPCTQDGAPSCPEPSRPVCAQSGPARGACVECTPENSTRCGGRKPLCLTELGICGCTDRDGDDECGGPASGLVCSSAAGRCVPGCSAAAGRNGCPAGSTCGATPGSLGACASPACRSDVDCATGPLGHCDAASGQCGECLQDAHCTAPQRCEASTRRCVECTAADSRTCSAAGAGVACLEGGTCGCRTSADCGGRSRACDPTVGRCVPGCEVGDTTCATGEVCVRTLSGVGRCVAEPAATDGGIAPDAGIPLDGGITLDGGIAVDAGLVQDAGFTRDAGLPGGAGDGGAKADGGAKKDGGPPVKKCDGGLCGPGRTGGDGCAAGGDTPAASLPWLLALGGLWAVRRRRGGALLALVCLLLGAAQAPPAGASTGADFQELLARGLLLEAAGKPAEAMATLARAHALAPERSDLRIRIAVLEAATGQQRKAMQTLRHVLRREPRHPDALRELGILFLGRRRPTDALRELRRARAVMPSDGVARFYEGMAHALLEDAAAARAAFTDTLAKAPRLAGQAHYQLALMDLEDNATRDAREHLRAAAKLSTDAETRELAKSTLRNVERQAARARKKWVLMLRLGLTYDTNISLFPDDSALLAAAGGAATDVRPTTAAGRASLIAAFDWTPLTGLHTFGLGLWGQQTKYGPAKVDGGLIPPTYDTTLLEAFAFYSREGRLGSLPVGGSLTVGHTEMWRDLFGDVRHYMDVNWARAALTLQYRPYGLLRVSYRAGLEDFHTGNKEHTADDRDGLQHLFAIESSFFLGEKVDLRFTLVGGGTDAHGTKWDNIFAGTALDLEVTLTRRFAITGGVATLYRDFFNSRYTRAQGSANVADVSRSGQAYFAFGRLAYKALGGVFLVAYNFMKDDSSLPELFGYTRHVFGVDYVYRY